jgi:hypothetical protein
MDGIQAAVLSVKLRRLAAANAARRANAALSEQYLSDEPRVIHPGRSRGQFARIPYLCCAGAGSGWSVAADGGARGELRHSLSGADSSAEGVFIFAIGAGFVPPMYPEFRPEQIRFVVDSLKECLRN